MAWQRVSALPASKSRPKKQEDDQARRDQSQKSKELTVAPARSRSGRSSSASVLTSEGRQLAARSDFARTLAARLSVRTTPVGPLLMPARLVANGPPPAPCVRTPADDDRPSSADRRRRERGIGVFRAERSTEPTQVGGRHIERRPGGSAVALPAARAAERFDRRAESEARKIPIRNASRRRLTSHRRSEWRSAIPARRRLGARIGGDSSYKVLTLLSAASGTNVSMIRQTTSRDACPQHRCRHRARGAAGRAHRSAAGDPRAVRCLHRGHEQRQRRGLGSVRASAICAVAAAEADAASSARQCIGSWSNDFGTIAIEQRAARGPGCAAAAERQGNQGRRRLHAHRRRQRHAAHRQPQRRGRRS